MNLLERVLTLLRANLNTVIEKSDDPEKALRQLQLDMRNQLVQVKTQVATAIAEGHKLRKRSEERKVEADLWMKKAEQAIQQGNDDAARVALVRYNDFTKQVQRYQQQQKDQEHLVRTMRTALRQLEVKISEVETTLDLLATRKRNALLQQRVFDALNKTGGLQEKERTTKAQDAVLEAEAQARALADLQQRDLDTQLDQLSAEKSLEEQLNMLKAKKRPLLQESNGQEAGLLRPQPRAHQPVRRREPETQKQLHSVSEPSTQKDVDIEQLKHLLDMPESSS
jgi:phage shock protein A